MNRAKPNDFFVDLDGIGRFRFNRRTYGSQIKTDAIIARILGPSPILAPEDAPEPEDAVMRTHANIVGLYSALVVECPPGWEDIEAIDLTDTPDLDAKILELHFKLREKLDSFRVAPRAQGSGAAGAQGGDPGPQDDAVLGAQPLQAAAD